MKAVIPLIFLAFIGSVNAEAIATTENKGGGKIVLTDEVCKNKGKTYKHLYRVYNYTSEGYAEEGCYIVEHDMAVVVWTGSDSSPMRYPLDRFSPVKRKAKAQI